MNYEEIFAYVTKTNNIHTLIFVKYIHQWNISQMNAKNIFINCKLHDEVCIVPPFGVSNDQGKVCN